MYCSSGQYCSFDLCQLCCVTACPIKVCFQEVLKFMMCLLSQIVFSECPSRAVTYKSGPVEGLSVEIVARGGHCQIFSLQFGRLYISNEINNVHVLRWWLMILIDENCM
jgi:hypothetical protein